MKKRRIVRLPERLYYGTVDYLAKQTPVCGIPLVTDASPEERYCESVPFLTNIYGLHFAYYALMEEMSRTDKDGRSLAVSGAKFGIVEVDVGGLDHGRILPFPGYLERQARSRDGVEDPGEDATDAEKQAHAVTVSERLGRFFDKVSESRSKWETSFDACGTIFYNGNIPASCVAKVVTYDPTTKNVNRHIMTALMSSKGPYEVRHEFKDEDRVFLEITEWLTFRIMSDDKDWYHAREGLDLYYKNPKFDHPITKKADE
jgi:hypothetical protein